MLTKLEICKGVCMSCPTADMLFLMLYPARLGKGHPKNLSINTDPVHINQENRLLYFIYICWINNIISLVKSPSLPPSMEITHAHIAKVVVDEALAQECMAYVLNLSYMRH